MTKLNLSSLFLGAVLTSSAHAANVGLSWDPVDKAEGYQVEQSVDVGATWTVLGETTDTSYTAIDVPEDSLVMYRVGSKYNTDKISIRYWSGAWYDDRLKPIASPSGTGID